MTLQDSVDAWHDCAVRVVTLLRGLPPDAWAKPTDCPRWNVHDVAAHLTAVETDLAGGGDDIPDAGGGGATVSPEYTQRGVDKRADTPPGVLIDELEMAVQARYEQLRGLDVDPGDKADRVPAGLDWSWQRLLSNRVVDVWIHEQDIRNAVGIEGGMDSPAAAHTVERLRSALPYIVGKRVAPPPGTAVRWTVTGHNGFDIAVRVGDDGRAKETDPHDDPTTTLELTEHAFTRLLAGRQDADQGGVTARGDADLAHRTLAQMSVIE